MTDEPEDPIQKAKRHDVETTAIAQEMNESTGLTWLWAMLFGPIYFWVHGFVAQGFIVLLISVPTLGIGGVIVSPFMAYPAWRKRAEQKAALAQMLRR